MARTRNSPEDRLAGLARLISHPLRVRILDHLSDGPASPRDVATATGEPLEVVAYHFKLLADAGAIRLQSTRPVRGAIQHTYALVPQVRRDLDGMREWLGRRPRRVSRRPRVAPETARARR